jgi:hypothetical protein
VWIGAATFALTFAVPNDARAQVQDDAALADEPAVRPPAVQSGAPSTGFDGRRPTIEPPEAELDPPLTTAQLHTAYPDLQVRVTPPPTLTVGLVGIYPLQPIGLGLGYDVYPMSRLRLNATISAGGTAVMNNQWRISFYAEVGVGVVVLRSPTEVVTEIKALPTEGGRKFHSKRSGVERALFGEEQPPPGAFVRATVPAFHSLELEGGLFTGLYPLYRCTAHCAEDPVLVPHTDEDASLQITPLFAGVRYVYFRWARSERVPFVTRFGFEAAVHAITNPFWRNDPSLFNIYDHHPGHHPVGARVNLRIIGLKCGANGGCFGLDLMGGYLPAPADALFSFGVVWQ